MKNMFCQTASPLTVSVFFFVTFLLTSTTGSRLGKTYVAPKHDPPITPNPPKLNANGNDLYKAFTNQVKGGNQAGFAAGYGSVTLIQPFIGKIFDPKADKPILTYDPDRVKRFMLHANHDDGVLMCDEVPRITGSQMEHMADTIDRERKSTTRDNRHLDQLIAGRHSLAIFRLTAQICCSYMMEDQVDPTAFENWKTLTDLDRAAQSSGVIPLIP